MENHKIGEIVKFFGKPYSYQGQYTDEQELELLKKNWKNARHGVIVKKGNHLFVTQFCKPA